MGFIYKITNLIDQKCYIGQTINTIEERWKNHLKKRNNCVYLKHALDKYGHENFKIEQIDKTEDINVLNELEIKYIIEYNSLVPNGYNLKHGGNAGGKQNEETKEKIRQTLIKNKSNCKVCDILIIGGCRVTCSDKCYTEFKSCKVIKYDLDLNFIKAYDSLTEAAEDNNVTKAGISMVCHGKRKQIKGFIYKESNS